MSVSPQPGSAADGKPPLRIATFSFRSIPLRDGCAGADKFAIELYPRLAARGHSVVAYNRLFKGEQPIGDSYMGVVTKNFYTPTRKKGFDSIIHSFKASWDIIRNNTADVVHIQNGGNSVFAVLLKLFGKKVFLSQDGLDWKRAKWPWYGRLYLRMTMYLTAFVPNAVIFDNIFCKEQFEKQFRRRYDFIPFGSEVNEDNLDESVLEELDLKPGGYFLFVGRFIPDKGLHYLIPAFEGTETDKKLVLIGGAPNPSDYERGLLATKDERVKFPGYVYGGRTHALMKNAYAYVQPSDIEGLSPVMLENMALGTPIICSDIVENRYVVGETGTLFKQADISDLRKQLRWALDNPDALAENGRRGQERALREFSWDAVTEAYERVFRDPAGLRLQEAPADLSTGKASGAQDVREMGSAQRSASAGQPSRSNAAGDLIEN